MFFGISLADVDLFLYLCALFNRALQRNARVNAQKCAKNENIINLKYKTS